jgi:heparin binding hemagglutinin HbhA
MNKTELPAPLYAAAGAGELAYQKLRLLPDLAARTVRTAGQTAEELRRRLATRERDLNTDWVRVRESAQRGTAVVVAKAATAQERAVTGYRNLVARGERVVNDRFGVATGQTEPARIEVEVGPVQGATRAGDAARATGPGESATPAA